MFCKLSYSDMCFEIGSVQWGDWWVKGSIQWGDWWVKGSVEWGDWWVKGRH
jgi:hypothetical protein